MLERLNPEFVYLPAGGAYTQTIRSKGTAMVHVAGTVSLDQKRRLVGKGDMGTQVRMSLENVGRSLQAAGAEPSDVVRIHIYTTDIDQYLAHGRQPFAEFFKDQKPVATLIGVSRLKDPHYLVEIEVDAVLDEDNLGD